MSCPFEKRTEAYALRPVDRTERAERAELERHLPGCASCTALVKKLSPVGRVLKSYEPFDGDDLTELELARIDRNVLAAMERGSVARPAARPFPFFGFAAMGALTAMALFLVMRPGAAPVHAPQAPVAVAAPQRSAAVAVALGEAQVIEPGQAPRALVPGTPLVEGERVLAGAGGVLLQTAPATGVHIPSGTVLGLDRLERDHTRFSLSQGTVLAEVKPLAKGHTFEVRCEDLTVAVRGTAFAVQRLANAVRVEVDHGLVQVSRGQTDSVLVPGGTFVEVPDGSALSALAPRPLEHRRPEFPLQLADAELGELVHGTVLPLQTDPPGARVRVDGRFRGLTPLTTLESEGPHTVRFEIDGRPPLELPLEAGALPVVSVPAAALELDATAHKDGGKVTLQTVAGPRSKLTQKAPPKALEDPQLIARREAMSHQVALHARDFVSCYERAMKRNPRLTGDVLFRITFDETGAVKDVEAGENTDAFFKSCAGEAMRAWTLPGTGEEETVEIPFALKRRE